MRRTRWVNGAVLGLLLASGAVVACDKESSGGGPSPTTSSSVAAAPSPAAAPSAAPSASAQAGEEDPASDELRDYHRHHHLGGVTMFIAMSIDTLGVDPEKKAQLEKIQADLETKMAPARDAEHDLMSTLADGIAAGKIDTAKVDAALAKVATASAGVHAASLDALTQLHDALSPVERAALVDKVKAHWEVWQKVNSEQAGQPREGDPSRKAHQEARPHARPGRQDHPGAERRRPHDAAERSEAGRRAHPGVRDCVRRRQVRPQVARHDGERIGRSHAARFGGARMAHFYEAVTPVLTPDQRTKLAAHLRER